jgi:hypothetical protein
MLTRCSSSVGRLTVAGLEFEQHSWGTSEDVEPLETQLMEVDSSVSASADFPRSSHFATLTPHLTYDEAAQHCNGTSKKLSLCSAAALCTDNVPLDGVRASRAVVPVADGKNKWMSVGSDRTCEVRDGGKWGTTAVYKKIKGLVACCSQSQHEQQQQQRRRRGTEQPRLLRAAQRSIDRNAFCATHQVLIR